MALLLASFTSTQECAYAENSSPPYFFGMIIAKKPFCFRYSQTWGGRSARRWVMSHSSSMRHSSSQGPSTNACSSAESCGAFAASSFCQCGSAGEQFAVPPDRPGLERLALGLRHCGQHAPVHHQERLGDVAQAEGVDVEQRHDAERQPQRHQPCRRRPADEHVPHQGEGCDPRRSEQGRTAICEEQRAADEKQEPEEEGQHRCRASPWSGAGCPVWGRLCLPLLHCRNGRTLRASAGG